ncbi:MAG TPA: hypothetical protein VG738_09535 [Chitinophagaceae bacterium]|nr:hypothetical protein [Chitinophagaceae bacterium]
MLAPGSPNGEYYGSDYQVIAGMLQENMQHNSSVNFSLRSETLNFLQFTRRMLLAFPAGMFIRSHIRKNKRLNYILQFKELLQVRNNIEKGSFAYDTLLFKQPALQVLQNKSHLANLVCLAILFGDEFIDGIAQHYGKQNIKTILTNSQFDYNLHYACDGKACRLYYGFDICDILPGWVLNSINSKYGITYKAFYGHLLFLLDEINIHLNRLNSAKQEEAAELICRVCNRCFDTYKADIHSFDSNYSLQSLLDYQKTKDDDIIQVLLTLRAVLLDKKKLQYQVHFSSWSSMVRSMQLYDDMQDAATDCDFQMNSLCYFAKNYFYDEWQWLQQNKLTLQKLSGLTLHTTIGLNMPGSCILCYQYACNIAHTKLNWVQRKIQNYLWRKNWLGVNNPLLKPSSFCISAVMNRSEKSAALKLHFIQKKIMQVDEDIIPEEMKLAYIIDMVLFDDELRECLFKTVTLKEKYFLIGCYLEFPVHKKAQLAKRLLAIYK